MFDNKPFNVKIDCALPFSWNKGKAYARERSFDALSFRLKGNADYFHGDKQYHVDENDILFVPSHYDYIIDSKSSEEVLVIHFRITESLFTEMKTFKPTNPDIFQRLFHQMCSVWNNKPIGYLYKLSSLFYEILEEIEIQSKKKTFSSTLFKDAVDYMHKNFSYPETTVESTAKHIGVSTVYLRRLFHANLNTTPIKYLNNLRINHAIQLLNTGYYHIEEIATLAGFSDAKYFSLLYKKVKGVPPSKNLKKALFTPNNV